MTRIYRIHLVNGPADGTILNVNELRPTFCIPRYKGFGSILENELPQPMKDEIAHYNQTKNKLVYKYSG